MILLSERVAMIWFVLALLSALFKSMKDVFAKRSLNNELDEYAVAWGIRFFALPFLLVYAAYEGVPSIGEGFYRALAISGGLNAIASVITMRAIRKSELSIAMPMETFTPVFLLMTTPVILGEAPGVVGVVGIFLIFIGSYVLNISKRREGALAPFRALLSTPGPRLMLFVAFIRSVTSAYDKAGVMSSSPVFWTLAVDVVLACALFPVMVRFSKSRDVMSRRSAGYLLPLGAVTALAMVCQMTAVTMALVVYVSAIKRLSTVMSVVWGRVVFNEKNGRERVLGSMVMVLGVVLITLS